MNRRTANKITINNKHLIAKKKKKKSIGKKIPVGNFISFTKDL